MEFFRANKQLANLSSQASVSNETVKPVIIDLTGEEHDDSTSSLEPKRLTGPTIPRIDTTVTRSLNLKRTAQGDALQETPKANHSSNINGKRRRMKHSSSQSSMNLVTAGYISYISQPQLKRPKEAPSRRRLPETIQKTMTHFFDVGNVMPSQKKEDVIERKDVKINDHTHRNTIDSLSKRLRSQKLVSEKTPTVFSQQHRLPVGFRYSEMNIQPGTFVEFKDGTFMKIRRVTMLGSILEGDIFVRVETFGSDMLEVKNGFVQIEKDRDITADNRIPSTYRGDQIINEVIQKVRTTVGKQAKPELWRKPATEILRFRNLRSTNQMYNEDNCITESQVPKSETMQAVREHGWLTCRWRDVASFGKNKKWKEYRLERLSEAEADEDWRIHSDELQELWGGDKPLSALLNKSFTFADAFCGARGVSTGAQQAGLTLMLAFDGDEKKLLTYRANFPTSESMCIFAADFIELAQSSGWRVDVLHLSPPCQPYSPANTTPNVQKDEINTTAILACADIIRCLRPRIVTVEETTGITAERHQGWFHALLSQLTELGFSVRWSVLKCSEYGVPQLRKRLIVIASAPGEKLPNFPRPTHAEGDVTIESVLGDLKKYHKRSPLSHHDTTQMFRTPHKPYDPNKLANTICCDGGDNYHPSGLRQFTPREFACLQTFPFDFAFGKTRSGQPLDATELRKQIGNAVPPKLAKPIFEEIVQSLRKDDEEKLQRLRGEGTTEVIVLD